MKAIILAGGQGGRLDKYNPEYTGIPKPMLPFTILLFQVNKEELKKFQEEIRNCKDNKKLKELQRQYRIFVFGKDCLGEFIK